MNDLNIVTITGTVAGEGKLKFSASGLAIFECNVSVSHTNYNGETNETTIPFTAFGDTAEDAASNIKRGDFLSIGGRINTNTYDPKDGGEVKIYVSIAVSSLKYIHPRLSGEYADTTKEDKSAEKPAPGSDKSLPF